MPKTLVQIPVDPDTAQTFEGLPAEDRERLEAVMGLLLRSATQPAGRSAVEIAREAGRQARENGMTPETLAEILRD